MHHKNYQTKYPSSIDPIDAIEPITPLYRRLMSIYALHNPLMKNAKKCHEAVVSYPDCTMKCDGALFVAGQVVNDLTASHTMIALCQLFLTANYTARISSGPVRGRRHTRPRPSLAFVDWPKTFGGADSPLVIASPQDTRSAYCFINDLSHARFCMW